MLCTDRRLMYRGETLCTKKKKMVWLHKDEKKTVTFGLLIMSLFGSEKD